MKHCIELETALVIVEYGSILISCTPPFGKFSSFTTLRQDVFYRIGIFSLICHLIISVYNIYIMRHDAHKMIKTISEASVMLAIMIKMLFWKNQSPNLQVWIADMERFLKQATGEQKKLLQNYVDKCSIPYIIIFIGCSVGPLLFVGAPLITPQPLPGDSVYPFSTDSYLVWTYLYITQSITIIQAGSVLHLDMYVSILLWYMGARFEMLVRELQTATNANDIRRCAREHQKLLRYIDELKTTICIMAIIAVTTTFFTVISGGFVLIWSPSTYDIVKYAVYEIGSTMELFLLTWPADNLIEISEKVGYAAFGCDWIGKPPEMAKNLSLIIQRSRTPIIIAVNGILPVLSLEFYGSTLTTTFSYFTTLRAITRE